MLSREIFFSTNLHIVCNNINIANNSFLLTAVTRAYVVMKKVVLYYSYKIKKDLLLLIIIFTTNSIISTKERTSCIIDKCGLILLVFIFIKLSRDGIECESQTIISVPYAQIRKLYSI